jgi:GNAT superfamily N-acetyltransferase
MDDASRWPMMVANMAGVFAGFARVSPEGRVLELDGVTAAMVPHCPERSVVNCVLYTDARLLGEALDTVARAYDEAGVRAWTVWVPEHDTDAHSLLAEAGHALDAKPAAMVRDLDGLDRPASPPALVEPVMRDVMRINDRAYGFDGHFERAFPELPPEPAHVYLATGQDGEPASTVITYETPDGECGIYLVATLPEEQGRGLARALMQHALAEARDRGCTTSSLQATARGRPVYERLGYRDIGAVHMWERRRAGRAWADV